MSQVILISGTSSGVGLAIAVNFAQQGYRVYASMRDPARGQDLKAALARVGAEAKLIAMDVTDDRSVEAAVSEVIK